MVCNDGESDTADPGAAARVVQFKIERGGGDRGPGPTPHDCPFEERTGPDTSEDGRVFEVVFGGFVSADFTYTGARPHLQVDEIREAERDVRSQLTPAYNARLVRLEDTRTPIHNGERMQSFTTDYLTTRFERGTATQVIAYCFQGGGVWTQVFYLRRIHGVWKIDSVEPAERRQA